MELPSRSDYADYFNVIRRPVSISILRVRDYHHRLLHA